MSTPQGPPLTWYQTRAPEISERRRRWRSWLRQRRLDLLACLGIAGLCFSQASVETLFRADRDFYNRLPLGAPTLVALLLNVVALAALGVVATEVVRRLRRPGARRLAAVAAAAALVIALNFARLTYAPLASFTDAIGRPGLIVLAMLGLAAALRWPQRALRAIRALAAGASPLGALTILLALWMFLELAGGPVFRRVEPTPLKASAPSLRRVVWVVFEELSQDVTFDNRPPGLELPEFDRLRRESVYADAARPPAGTTELSMPALITGRPVVAVAPSSPNELDLTFADGKTARWSQQPNVFQQARVFGYDTAMVGWHLPYPRVLGASLGMADWRSSTAYEQTRGETVARALRAQWSSLLPPVHVRALAAERLAELGDVALRTATDGRFGLVMLHLPLPQPPAVYDTATGRLTAWSFAAPEAAYLDNLVLADRVLSELRRGLERARLGDRTWLVVSSARWWRAATPVDHRVPFLVRPPDGGRAAHVDGAFNTLGTRDLVLAILRGSIGDAADAATWLRRYPSTPPRSYTGYGRPIY
jgi:hypothetical protein